MVAVPHTNKPVVHEGVGADYSTSAQHTAAGKMNDMQQGGAPGASLPSGATSSSVDTAADAGKQPVRRSDRVRKKRVMFDVWHAG
jgi:hypothetical protein